jgi:hypothetical protein
MSCNRRTSYYMQRNRTATCANVVSSRDYRTSATTRGSPAHDPTVPIKCDGHGSVSRRDRRDSWYDHRRTDSNCSNGRTEAAVQSNHQPGPVPTSRLASSLEAAGEPQSPLPQHKDDAPVFRSSNDSRTRNICPANRPSHRINSLAGHATPLAGEAGAVSSPS